MHPPISYTLSDISFPPAVLASARSLFQLSPPNILFECLHPHASCAPSLALSSNAAQLPSRASAREVTMREELNSIGFQKQRSRVYGDEEMLCIIKQESDSKRQKTRVWRMNGVRSPVKSGRTWVPQESGVES